ncbi:MAG TPA: phosphatidate cytidylyltransferase [Planctomycetes bacterium]|nr:phosphatidate cytidylyltransferase [Planctomycetota bacterium]HIN79466.1 phosphatidate cytidylyltransferase [Planctomycetota bacterium]
MNWIPNLPQAVENCILIVCAILMATTLVVRVLVEVKPKLDLGEIPSRLRSWWIITVLVSLALVLGRPYLVFFFALVSYLALKEFYSIIPTRRVDRRVLFWAYLSIPVQYLWIEMEWYGMFIVFIPVYLFLFLPLRMVLIGKPAGFLNAAGTMNWALMTSVFCISHIAYLAVLPANVNPSGGAGLILYLLILTEGNDVAQFFWGKTLGRTPISPTVSPNKTLAGFLGGVLTTVGLAWFLAPYLTPFDNTKHILISGVIIGFSGYIGDIVMSAFKRDLGIKDTGSTLPGHGGVLDRIDSLTYTAPLFFHYTYYLYY